MPLSPEIKAEEPIDVYATKYRECWICGIDADCMYVSQIDGLCNACRSNEEYYEHVHRVSGD